MEIKVGCGCGQNYKFDVEPLNGRMPIAVACPSCGADGTQAANKYLAQQSPYDSTTADAVPAADPVVMASPIRPAANVRVRVATPAAAPTSPPPLSAPPGAMAARAAIPKPAASGPYSLPLGILGAVLGAGLGVGLMFGFYQMTGFHFPLTGTSVGILTGLGARILARGTDQLLGVIAGALALFTTAGTLYLIYGEVLILFLVTLLVSAYFAYRIAG